MSKPTLYGYEPQRHSVLALLGTADILPGPITWVREIDQLRGLSGLTFVNVTNHPNQPSDDMIGLLMLNGFVTFDISDLWMRDWHRRNGKGRAA